MTLGVTGSTVADEKSNIYGIYVEDVDKGSNAFNAGIKPTDIIVEADNEKVKNIESLADLLKKHSVGDIIKLKVIRGDTTKDISVTLN
ncbi:PDZ domain-containing protein [Clostridium perfringens]